MLTSLLTWIQQHAALLLHWAHQHISELLTWMQQHAEPLLTWVHQYGPIALFVLLALGIIILPIPDESLMVAAGFLIGNGDLKPIPTILAAILGAWCGITISYLIGVYISPYIISTRLGAWLGLQGPHFIRTQAWFNRVGKWSLVFGYFIPGFRHFAGYIAGSLALPYKEFSRFAYSGGALWASLFLTLGYGLNQKGSAIIEFFTQFWR
jgi:membrane protein DedA with SNARE-associated domain